MTIPISRIQEVSLREKELEDVIEISNSYKLAFHLEELERRAGQFCTEIQRIRQGIVLHEAGSKATGLSRDERRAFLLRSYYLFNELCCSYASQDILPIITAYRASVLMRLGIEGSKLIEIKNALDLFGESIRLYGELSGLPEFLRAKSRLLLPWYWFNKTKYARQDFESVINKKVTNSENILLFRLKSFSYYGMALITNRRWNRKKVLTYLNNAIFLDPDFLAARERAEQLRTLLTN